MNDITISEVDSYFMGKEIQRNMDALTTISSKRELHDEFYNQIDERVNQERSHRDSVLSVV
jgi:hypothetical protein